MKRRILAWITILCLMVMTVSPVSGTLASSDADQAGEQTPAMTAEEPAATEPTEPETSETTEENEDETTEPGENETTEAGENETTEAGENETAESGETETAKPEENETTEPDGNETTEPGEDEATETGESETTESDGNETTEPGEDEMTEPDGNEATEPDETETTEPGEGETTEPGEDEMTEPDENETTEPGEDETTEPDENETTKPDEDEKTEPVSGLNAGIGSGRNHIFAGEGSIPLTLSVSGGEAPYAIEVNITVDGMTAGTQTMSAQSEGMLESQFTPDSSGNHVFTVRVTDAGGATAKASVTVPVAMKVVEYAKSWEATVEDVELSGDWREDIIAIAKTQLGYEESKVNFIIEDGVRRAYTRYGEWYGSQYAEWCGMFVSFCLKFADIPGRSFPREAHVGDWIELLKDRDAYEKADEYQPGRGDLVFFQAEGKDYATHMGIVENVTADTLYTIEGNVEGAVRRRSYAIDDAQIIGYANTQTLMKKAGVQVVEVEEAQTLLSGSAETAKDSVNMRAKPDTESTFIRKLKTAGTKVKLVGKTVVGDMTWYLVGYQQSIGYIRGDLIRLIEDEAAQAAEIIDPFAGMTPAPAATPTGEPEEEGFFDPNAPLPTPTPSPTPIPEEELILGADGEVTFECACTDETGSRICGADCACTCHGPQATQEPLDGELAAWIEETSPTDEMIARAKRASSLDSIVLEGDRLIYVRTGETMAYYDEKTGYLIDERTGMIVAVLDMETGMILPLVSDGDGQ